jgi:hypothetical protein
MCIISGTKLQTYTHKLSTAQVLMCQEGQGEQNPHGQEKVLLPTKTSYLNCDLVCSYEMSAYFWPRISIHPKEIEL